MSWTSERAGLTISAVSSLLSIPVPTIRSWERRYGFPVPARTDGRHRRYSTDEIDQLRDLRDEITRGRAARDAVEVVRGLAPGSERTSRVRRGRGRDPPGPGRAAGDSGGGGRDARRGARDLRGRTARDARDGIAMEGRRVRHGARTSGDRGRAGLARAPVGDGPGRVPSVPARPRLRPPRPAHDRPRGVRRDPRPPGMARSARSGPRPPSRRSSWPCAPRRPAAP